MDLNHEVEEDDDRNTYTVVLKATDGPDSDSITVTITVTDRNEAPSTPAEAEEEGTTTDDNNAPEFAAATATRTIAQGTAAGSNIGAPVTATDDDTDDTLTYSVSGADATSFGIDSGQRSADDDCGQRGAGGRVTYEVRVTVTDGEGGSDYVDVTITVAARLAVESWVTPPATAESSRVEVIAAFRAYVAGQYTKPQIIGIFQQYVAGR